MRVGFGVSPAARVFVAVSWVVGRLEDGDWLPYHTCFDVGATGLLVFRATTVSGGSISGGGGGGGSREEAVAAGEQQSVAAATAAAAA